MSRTDTSRFTTGSILLHSASQERGVAPGLVDSPPMSMMSAPSSAMFTARRTASSALKYLPPSENESGVTFKMPITLHLSGIVRLPFRSLRKQFLELRLVDYLRPELRRLCGLGSPGVLACDKIPRP